MSTLQLMREMRSLASYPLDLLPLFSQQHFRELACLDIIYFRLMADHDGVRACLLRSLKSFSGCSSSVCVCTQYIVLYTLVGSGLYGIFAALSCDGSSIISQFFLGTYLLFSTLNNNITIQLDRQ